MEINKKLKICIKINEKKMNKESRFTVFNKRILPLQAKPEMMLLNEI